MIAWGDAKRRLLAVLFSSIAMCVSPVAFSESIKQNFGDIEVTAQFVKLPPDFAPFTSANIGYRSFATVIVSLEILAYGKPIYIPLDAFAGLGDPRSIDLEVIQPKKQWRFKITGGDGAFTYCAVMALDTTQVRSVNLATRCSDKIPFASKRYAPVEILK